MNTLNITTIGSGTLDNAMKDLQYLLTHASKEFTKNTALGSFTVNVDKTEYTEFVGNKYGLTYSITHSHNNNMYVIIIKED